MTWRSAIYRGTVSHDRVRPERHRLHYRVFCVLFDLDEIDAMDERLWLFSRNQFNLFSFYDRDHGPSEDESIAAHIRAQLRAAGFEPDGGRIAALCLPRILGYVFNPLTVYFCYGRAGNLDAILYEVNNTHRERQTYVLAAPRADTGALDQRCPKSFNVSPFNGHDGRYRFRVLPPGEDVLVGITLRENGAAVLKACLRGRRRALGDSSLMAMAAIYPFLTLKVIAGIHFEALRLWLKRVPMIRRQPAPAYRVVSTQERGRG